VDIFGLHAGVADPQRQVRDAPHRAPLQRSDDVDGLLGRADDRATRAGTGSVQVRLEQVARQLG
jgi:hypothetical protein